MAVIMKIRDKFGVVIVILIALAIVSFLLMDAINSNSNILSPNSNNAGSINGTKVTIQDFEKKVQEAVDNYKMSSQNANVDDKTMWQIREQTWTQHVNDVLYKEEYNKLGIQVTPEELFELVQGSNPHPAVVQSFTNPNTGQFDPAQVVMFLQRLDEDQTGDSRTRWLNFEKFLKEDRLRTKYATLVKKGMYVPSWEAKEDYQVKNSSVNFDYVYVPFTTVSDEEVKVTDAELSKFISNNESRFKQDESRSIEYVSFDILPTADDTMKAYTKLLELQENFKTTNSDSVFLKLYSDHPFDPAYYAKDELKSSVADTFFKIDTATIIGPYLEDSAYVMAKLIDRKLIPDSVQAKHIYLEVKNLNDRADIDFKRNQADSLKMRLEAKEDFALLALQFSDDEQTKFSGGDWGWIKPGEKFPTINNNLFFAAKQGDIFVAADEKGFHVVQVVTSKPVKQAVKVAFLTRQIVPSSETERALFAKASEFAGNHSTGEKFKEAKATHNILTAENIKKADNEVFGLGSSRELVKWVFSAEENEVSTVFSFDDKFIVARLSKVKEEGLTPLADIKPEVEFEVKKEKKAAIITKKITDAGSKSLPDVAAMFNTAVASAANLSFVNNLIESVGLETAVVNKALAMNQGEVSAPLTGSNGVFVIQVTAKNAPEAPGEFSFLKNQIMRNQEMRVDASLQEAIKKAADITDERYKFY